MLQTTAPWSRTVSHNTSHSPGEKLQACQENKHVWHSTNQAIMVSVRGLRIRPKAQMQSSDQALHNFFKTGTLETQTTLCHPSSVLQNFLSPRIYENLHRNSIINVAELSPMAANPEQFPAELRHKGNWPLAQLISGFLAAVELHFFSWNLNTFLRGLAQPSHVLTPGDKIIWLVLCRADWTAPSGCKESICIHV